ncbi:hypothetical protein [Gordonia paraffinivorans]|uniref:hypothetical protein n=1 Tax=Gordonia paraffinivorans TaxID=175628 RepID=UPI001E5936A5|nr:hypothetical protein [Gordonia paraffinivorans]MCD2146364.1 hypothetical protein [Gordonia paraffinivorans]
MPENAEGETYPHLRVFAFDHDGADYQAEVLDYTDREVTRVVDDADYYFTDTGKLWSLALVDEQASDEAKLLWLSGYDYLERPANTAERRRRLDMQLRYLGSRSRRHEPVVLPDGLRVIRMFPEWGGAGPLWETFTDNYPADPAKLGLSESLARDLEKWNDDWAAGGPDTQLEDPMPWLARGRELFDRVQHELQGIAEVASTLDFDRLS